VDSENERRMLDKNRKKLVDAEKRGDHTNIAVLKSNIEASEEKLKRKKKTIKSKLPLPSSPPPPPPADNVRILAPYPIDEPEASRHGK